jgi:hypothetical protein
LKNFGKRKAWFPSTKLRYEAGYPSINFYTILSIYHYLFRMKRLLQLTTLVCLSFIFCGCRMKALCRLMNDQLKPSIHLYSVLVWHCKRTVAIFSVLKPLKSARKLIVLIRSSVMVNQ